MQCINYEDKRMRLFNRVAAISLIIFFCPLMLSQLFGHLGLEWTVAVGLLLILSAVMLINRKREMIKWQRVTLCAIGLIALYILQAVFACLFVAEYGWDVGVCKHAAEDIAYGFPNYDYLSTYPNNTLITLYMSLFVKLVPTLGLESINSAIVYASIFWVDVSFIISILLAKRFIGGKVLKAMICVSIPLYLFSPWLVVPYTDITSMPMPVITLWAYCCFNETDRKAKKALYLFIMGLAGGIGYALKPTAIIMLIAVLITHLISVHGGFRAFLKRVAAVIICVSIVFAVTEGVMQLLYHLSAVACAQDEDFYEDLITPEIVDARSYPMTHFIMMGLTENSKIVGGFNPHDFSATAAIVGYKNKTAFNLEVIGQRLKARGLFGTLGFLCRKAAFIYNDGTFYFGEEGGFITNEPFDQSEIGEAIQNFFYHEKEPFAILANGIWSAMLLLIILSLFRKVNGDRGIFSLRLCIIGLTLFLLLFEARSRYLVNHLPLFAIMAAQGLTLLSLNRNKKNHRGSPQP